jgi:uncharacterized protein (DUF885 family)
MPSSGRTNVAAGSRSARRPSSRDDGKGVTDFDALVDAFLENFWSTHPVDATFAGVDGYDHLLPPAGSDAPERERRELTEFARRLAAMKIADSAAARIDAQLMRGSIAATLAQAGPRSRYVNPAWYTGEIAFGIIALLLPGSIPRELLALEGRIAAIPDQLADAAGHLGGCAVPADWVVRARRELAAIGRLIERGLPQHPLGAGVGATPAAHARAALTRFDGIIAALPDADPAAGVALFALLARDVHGLLQTPAEIERDAAAEFARLEGELQEAAARLDPARSWAEIVAGVLAPDLDGAAAFAAYQRWNARALDAGEPLVTPAADYGLAFEPLPAWAAGIADDLYFLFYRSPAAYRPGTGSVYWVTPPQSTAAVKLIHAVHHGSIGHHTQNARARAAASQLARIAGSDGASGIALLGGGSMVEGWACYAEELLAEVPGFYTAHEQLLLTAFELRNVATCLGDLRLHTGVWTLDDVRSFYRDDAAFAPARVWSETTRNSMFPASRIMYWLGTRQIRALRAASPLPAKAFHDRLLSFGAAPVAVVGPELQTG